MNAEELKNVILFMSNRFSYIEAVKIWGKWMGDHFFNKWAAETDPDKGTMRLFYDMSEENMQTFLDYISAHYNYRSSSYDES